MRSSLSRVNAPTTEPLTLAELKAHLRIDHTAEDSLIGAYLTAARQRAEADLRRQLITATWRLSFDWFPGNEIELPLPPLQSVALIRYVDLSGSTQTLSSDYYQADTYREPGRLRLREGYTWPSTDDVLNAVQIEFVAGYGSNPSDVPETIRQAIRLLAAHWYEHREAVSEVQQMPVPLAYDSLVWTERVMEIH